MLAGPATPWLISKSVPDVASQNEIPNTFPTT